MDAAQYVELLMLRVCSAKRFTVGTGGVQQTPQQWLQSQSRTPPMDGGEGRAHSPGELNTTIPAAARLTPRSNHSEHTALQQQCWQRTRGNQQNKTRAGGCLGSGLCLQLW